MPAGTTVPCLAQAFSSDQGDFYEHSYRAGRSDQDAPLGWKRVWSQPGLDGLHAIPGHGDSCSIDRADPFDDGMSVFPGHAHGPRQHRLAIGQPMLFQIRQQRTSGLYLLWCRGQ